MAQKLDDKVVRALEQPPKKDGKGTNRITYDSMVSGFGVRITSAGAVSFVLNYRRKADGKERRYTIGQFPTWNVTAAREEAKRLTREVDGGGDPVGKIRADREAPTVADLCTRFVEEHVEKKRPSTQRDYTAIVDTEIKPALGTKKVAAIEYEDIERLHSKITKRAPYKANRTLAVLSKMFSLAVKWKMRADNPVRGVERNQEQKRKRYLSRDELARLTKAFAAHDGRQAADIFRLLLLTGARCGEVLSASWDQFDLGEGVWTKPASNTKQKADHTIPLSAPARQLLNGIRKRGEDEKWVFPSPGGSGHRTAIKKDWERICKAARIIGLRIHDLRHSYASELAAGGHSLLTIGALLGHSQPATTHRYAHLFDDPLRKATESVGAILSGKRSAPVVPMRGRR
jgi:integrase